MTEENWIRRIVLALIVTSIGWLVLGVAWGAFIGNLGEITASARPQAVIPFIAAGLFNLWVGLKLMFAGSNTRINDAPDERKK